MKNFEKPSAQDPEEEKKGKGISRREFLEAEILALSGIALGAKPTESKAETPEQNRVVKNSRLEMMNDHNLHEGFARYKVYARFEGGQEKLVGSFFNMEDAHAKADFISNRKHPQYFDNNGHPNFQDISRKNNNTVLIVSGGFLSSKGHHQIEGIALEDGEMVGEYVPARKFNGLLVIKNGVPEIEYLNQIPNINAFLSQAKEEGWSLFQQTSFIRPGGRFTSSNPNKYELRFFVEGEGKKGVINFSENMTYSEALQVMQEMSGFRIEKAIGLDTGITSQGYFYDKNGKDYLMIDENYGRGKSYTNMLVLYSNQ